MRLVLSLLLALAAVPAWGSWFRVVEGAEGDIYIDPSTVRWDGDLRIVWTVQDLKQRHKDGEFSRRVLREYDCKEKTSRALSFSTHSEPMGNGKTLYSHTVPGQWRSYAPGTNGDAALKIVCATTSRGAAAATPGPTVAAQGTGDVALTGQYHKDKDHFFPDGRDLKREELFLRALTEGAEAEPKKPNARFSAEENLAVEYDAASFMARSFRAGHWNYGIVLGKVGRWKEAADALRQAVAVKPSHAGTWANLGVANHALGRFRESVEAFDKAVLLDPAYFTSREAQRQVWQASRDAQPIRP